MARLVVTIARKEIMGSSSVNNYLGNWTRKGAGQIVTACRGHAPCRVALIFSIRRRSESVTAVTEGGPRWCPLPAAFWWEPPALAGAPTEKYTLNRIPIRAACRILSLAFGERVGGKFRCASVT